MKSLGTVVGLWRYPVKSMGEEALREADVSWHGIAGDRRWAFVRGGVARSGFPWLTIRELPEMGQYRPGFIHPDKPDASPTRVRTPSGAEFDVVDPALAEALGHEARVIKQNRGVFDTFPLSFITSQTVASLGEVVGAELDVQRFRPNFLIDATDGSGFPEDGWVGATLQIGTARMRVDKRDGRCAVINVDPTTSERDPSVLRAVAGTREGCLGVYGSTVQPGRVAVGDAVRLVT